MHKSEATVIESTPHNSLNRKGFSSIASDVEREPFYANPGLVPKLGKTK